MRYVTFSLPGDPTERFGAVGNDRVIDVDDSREGHLAGTAAQTVCWR